MEKSNFRYVMYAIALHVGALAAMALLPANQVQTNPLAAIETEELTEQQALQEEAPMPPGYKAPTPPVVEVAKPVVHPMPSPAPAPRVALAPPAPAHAENPAPTHPVAEVPEFKPERIKDIAPVGSDLSEVEVHADIQGSLDHQEKEEDGAPPSTQETAPEPTASEESAGASQSE